MKRDRGRTRIDKASYTSENQQEEGRLILVLNHVWKEGKREKKGNGNIRRKREKCRLCDGEPTTGDSKKGEKCCYRSGTGHREGRKR